MTPVDPRDPSELSLAEIYCLEVEEQCTLLSDSLRMFREDPSAKDLLDPLIRAGHTIRGGARIVGRQATARIAHALETLFLTIQQECVPLSPEAATVVSKAVELITLITAIDDSEAAHREQEHEAGIEEIVAALQSVTVPSSKRASSVAPSHRSSAEPRLALMLGPGSDESKRRPEDTAGGTKKRVLVVEDSATVRALESDLLNTAGYEVDVAVDGVDGWNAVRSWPYDLVVTDVEMPRLDGFELVRMIRSDAHLRRMPLVIVSHKEEEADRRLGLEAGADCYLSKGSLEDESFLRVVSDLIKKAEK